MEKAVGTSIKRNNHSRQLKGNDGNSRQVFKFIGQTLNPTTEQANKASRQANPWSIQDKSIFYTLYFIFSSKIHSIWTFRVI